MSVPLTGFLKKVRSPVTIRAAITLLFSFGVFTACMGSLAVLIYVKVKSPQANSGAVENVFLTTMGYMVGILTGLLGLRS